MSPSVGLCSIGEVGCDSAWLRMTGTMLSLATKCICSMCMLQILSAANFVGTRCFVSARPSRELLLQLVNGG